MTFAAAAALSEARVLYLFAPLLVSAAVAAVVLRFDWLRALYRPIDFGATLGGRRIFGDSKSWRGVVLAISGSIVTVAVQQRIAPWVPASLQLVDYRALSPIGFGGAMGAGAMIGELPNSFVKRRIGVPPGGTAPGWRGVVFYLWDQLDLLTGVFPLIASWVPPTAWLVGLSVLNALLVHPLVALIGYLVGARSSPR